MSLQCKTINLLIFNARWLIMFTSLQHSIYVEKLPISYLNHRLTSVLPVPEGEYCVRTTYLNSGIQRAMTRVYVSIS